MILTVPEKKPGILTGILIYIIEKFLKKRIPLARVLIWSPRIALTSLRMELAIESISKKIPSRLAKLIRLKVSLTANCPFCIDMNSQDYDVEGLSKEDIFSIRDGNEDNNNSFTTEEKLILRWIESQTNTPLIFSEDLKLKLRETFDPKTLIIIAALGAKVNYWARFMQALGIQAAGFQESCPFLPETPQNNN